MDAITAAINKIRAAICYVIKKEGQETDNKCVIVGGMQSVYDYVPPQVEEIVEGLPK